jgi:hypothetical protein
MQPLYSPDTAQYSRIHPRYSPYAADKVKYSTIQQTTVPISPNTALYSPNTARIQPQYSFYTASIQLLYRLNTALIHPQYSPHTADTAKYRSQQHTTVPIRPNTALYSPNTALIQPGKRCRQIHPSVQYSAWCARYIWGFLQCSAVQCSAVQCSAVQWAINSECGGLVAMGAVTL